MDCTRSLLKCDNEKVCGRYPLTGFQMLLENMPSYKYKRLNLLSRSRGNLWLFSKNFVFKNTYCVCPKQEVEVKVTDNDNTLIRVLHRQILNLFLQNSHFIVGEIINSSVLSERDLVQAF